MEAVPRMPMIWLDLKEAGDFLFQAAVKKVSAALPSPLLPRLSAVGPRVTPLRARPLLRPRRLPQPGPASFLTRPGLHRGLVGTAV